MRYLYPETSSINIVPWGSVRLSVQSTGGVRTKEKIPSGARATTNRGFHERQKVELHQFECNDK